MRQAILAIEDARFYQHGAIDPKGTIRALINNLEHKAVQGGSTLAQQYVKNALILTAKTTAERNAAFSETPARKLRELRMAINVEHELTKNQLLAAYLNVAYFDNQAYGVQIAAQRYFHTTAKKLTLAQAALLAGIVENPSLYNPLVHPGFAKARRNVVLERMLQLHDITKARAQKAMSAPLGLHASTDQLQDGLQRPVHQAGQGRVLLRLRALGDAPEPRVPRGLPGDEPDRRAEDLHHPGPGRPARRPARGELHAAGAAEPIQPGRQRGHRGAHPARHRPGPGHRRWTGRTAPGPARPTSTTRWTPSTTAGRACRPAPRPSCSRC